MATADPLFDVRFDRDEGVLVMRISGFWTVATLAAFTARLLFEVGRARLAGRRFAVLSDARAFPVQSPQVAAGFEVLTRKSAAYHRGRTAIVVGSTLAKLQAERTMTASGLRVFLDVDAARAWLAEGTA